MARVAAAVAALAALAGASSSAPTTTGGRIVFASDRASTSVHAALYTIGVDRAHAAPVRLTRTAGIDKPAWSPDGRRIAFIREHGYRFLELATVDVADRRVRVLVPRAQGSDPAWSPDGRTIAYDHGNFGIVLVDVATGARRLLGDWGNTTSWSPDGKKLAAIRFDDVNVLDVRTGRRVR